MNRSIPTTIAQYIFYFLAYSAIGAVMETLFRLVTEGELYGINGILHIPILPIYGLGALVIIGIHNWVKKPIPLFIVATILTSVLEFISSWIFEMLFHTKLWDYSEKHFNIDGRVSLGNSVGFGAAAVLLVYELHPFIKKYVERIPSTVIVLLAVFIICVLGTDVAISITERLNATV
jgi:uncharacterized membrane protein